MPLWSRTDKQGWRRLQLRKQQNFIYISKVPSALFCCWERNPPSHKKRKKKKQGEGKKGRTGWGLEKDIKTKKSNKTTFFSCCRDINWVNKGGASQRDGGATGGGKKENEPRRESLCSNIKERDNLHEVEQLRNVTKSRKKRQKVSKTGRRRSKDIKVPEITTQDEKNTGLKKFKATNDTEQVEEGRNLLVQRKQTVNKHALSEAEEGLNRSSSYFSV